MDCDKLLKEALDLMNSKTSERTEFNKVNKEARELRASLNSERKPKAKGYNIEAGDDIKFTSKLKTALKKISRQTLGGIKAKYNAKSLKAKLLNEGVSKAELELSGLFKEDIAYKDLAKYRQLSKILTDDEIEKLGALVPNTNKKQSLGEYIDKENAQGLSTINLKSEDYSSITFNEGGKKPGSQYEQKGIVTGNPKFSDNSGAHFSKEGLIAHTRAHIGNHPEFGIGKKVVMDEFQSDWFQSLKPTGVKTPFNYEVAKKFAIVNSLDKAIKAGLNEVVIPINRTINNLVGTNKVTKMYRDLNRGVLPKIRKELAKKRPRPFFCKFFPNFRKNPSI